MTSRYRAAEFTVFVVPVAVAAMIVVAEARTIVTYLSDAGVSEQPLFLASFRSFPVASSAGYLIAVVIYCPCLAAFVAVFDWAVVRIAFGLVELHVSSFAWVSDSNGYPMHAPQPSGCGTFSCGPASGSRSVSGSRRSTLSCARSGCCIVALGTVHTWMSTSCGHSGMLYPPFPACILS